MVHLAGMLSVRGKEVAEYLLTPAQDSPVERIKPKSSVVLN